MQAVHLRRGKLRNELPEFLAQDEIRFDLLVSFRVKEREVHRVADFAGQQIARDHFGNFDAAFFLRLVRACAKVGRQNDVRMFAERMRLGQRFGDEHVQRGGSDLAGVQRGDQIVFNNDLTARAVHDANLGLHFRERRRVQHAARLLRHGHVDADEIRVAINAVQFADEFHAERLGAGFGEERIVGQHLHAEGQRTFRHFATDAAHAEHAEGFAGELDTLKLFPVPLARDHRGVGLRHFAREVEQHGEGQFRRGDRVAARRVHDDHTALRGGFHVNVVHAHAGAADDAQLGGGFENFLGHLGFGTHDHRDHVADDGEQFRFGKAFGQNQDLKFRPLLQQLNALW